MKRVLLKSTFSGLVLCACALSAQAQKSPSIRLDADISAAIAPVVDRAERDGLPVSLLKTKAAEGVLRGASPERIVTAVTSLANRLTQAKQALAPAQPSELKAGADAIALGVSPTMLKKIRQQSPMTSVAVPVAVLAQLVAQGATPQSAAQLILQLIERGASTQQLAALPAAIDNDIASGEPASRALDARAGNILAALGLRSVGTLPASGDPTATTLSNPAYTGRAGKPK